MEKMNSGAKRMEGINENKLLNEKNIYAIWSLSIKSFLKCNNSAVCLNIQNICDMNQDCPSVDDEYLC